jgi:hypothetical protein
MKLDLHIHTRYSRTKRWGSASLIEPHQLLDTAVELGLDGVAVIDHDEIEGSLIVAQLASNWGLVAIPGIEITSKDGHILGYGITEAVPKGLSAAETIDRIHGLGGIAVAAHPLNMVMSLRKKQIVSLLLDALETHNSRSLRNRRTAELQRILPLGRTGGSDAHAIGEVGAGITELHTRVTDAAGVLAAVTRCKSIAHGAKSRYRTIARASIHTAATQKREHIKRRIFIGLGIPAA